MTDLLQRLEPAVKELGIKIRYKDESRFMRFCAWLLFFNRTFMTRFTTTWGRTIYFPSRIWATDTTRAGKILAHEMVHADDNRRFTLPVMTLIYGFPQVLSLLALLAFLAFLDVRWLWCLTFLVFLAPFPAPGRVWSEMRGYAITMAVRHWEGESCFEVPEYIVRTFTGPNYYWMWPFDKAVRRRLDRWRQWGNAGQLTEHLPIAGKIESAIKG